MITIREAGIEDAQNITHLGATTFDQSFGHLFKDRNDLINYFESTFSLDKIRNSIAKKNNVYWMVLDKDKPVGYAKILLNTTSEFIEHFVVCKLQRIYFLADYNSKGIGSTLQQLITEKAIECQQKYMWLSVLKENEKAIRFYKKNNYKIVGEHPFSIGKENFEFWVMSTQLT